MMLIAMLSNNDANEKFLSTLCEAAVNIVRTLPFALCKDNATMIAPAWSKHSRVKPEPIATIAKYALNNAAQPQNACADCRVTPKDTSNTAGLGMALTA